MRWLIEHWYVVAVAGAAVLGGWIALGKPGAVPGDDERLAVRAELESVLRAGEPSELRKMAMACGALSAGDRSVDSLREPTFSIDSLELEPLAMFGARTAPGRARITLTALARSCAFEAAFRYRWERTGDVKTTVHGPHASTHGVVGKRAVLLDLTVTHR